MTGFSGIGREEEDYTALHGKPPPDEKATPSERLLSSAIEVVAASLPDSTWWLENNHAELQEWGHDALTLAAALRRHQNQGGLPPAHPTAREAETPPREGARLGEKPPSHALPSAPH